MNTTKLEKGLMAEMHPPVSPSRPKDQGCSTSLQLEATFAPLTSLLLALAWWRAESMLAYGRASDGDHGLTRGRYVRDDPHFGAAKLQSQIGTHQPGSPEKEKRLIETP